MCTVFLQQPCRGIIAYSGGKDLTNPGKREKGKQFHKKGQTHGKGKNLQEKGQIEAKNENFPRAGVGNSPPMTPGFDATGWNWLLLYVKNLQKEYKA